MGPAERTDDPGRDRLADAERIAHCQHPVPHLEAVGFGKCDGRQFAGIDFQHGQVGFRIGTDDVGGYGLAVGQRHLDFIRSLDDVLIGENVTVRADDHPGAQIGHFAWARIQAIAKEIAEDRILQGRVGRAADFLLCKDVDYRRNDLLRRRRKRFNGSEGAARGRCGLLDSQARRLRLPAQEIGFEQGNDEQYAKCHGGGLSEEQPELAYGHFD